jgi:signal transduction histidine kinase
MLFIGLTFGLVMMINRRLIAGMEHDIIQRQQAEEALRESHQLFTSALQYRTNVLEALHQVTLELVNRHQMDDILQTLLAKIGALLDASDISFDMLESDDTLVTYAVTSEQPLQKGDRMRRGAGGWLSWQAIESGQTAVLDDYSTWSKRRPSFNGHPIHAIMIVPIHQRERVVGAINISRSEANKPFNDTDAYAAEQLAQMIALVLDNAQLYSQLQAELAESVQREENLHQAQAQVIEQQRRLAIFDERQRMGRDLHDSVNQSIHSLVLFSETLDSMLEKNNLNRARQISERLQASARQALKETRLLLYQNQASIDGKELNLIEELNARLTAIELHAGVKAQVTLEGSLDDCPKEWHENLFWIAIEALNNSLKHAQAQSVQIIIRCSPAFVELEVVDDGRGFDPARPGPGGYGLRNMQERADVLNGKLTVASISAKGTAIRFRAERVEHAKTEEPVWTK